MTVNVRTYDDENIFKLILFQKQQVSHTMTNY